MYLFALKDLSEYNKQAMFDEKQLWLGDLGGAARLIVELLVVTGLLSGGSRLCAAEDGHAIDFDREIRPIFSESCYPCHGPDENKRKANLRFDRKEIPFKE
jgi:hypothetical protein